MADYDAIIIGAGHNGLICAAYLARAGWRVLVLEANSEVGGGLRSGEATLPGFRHDLYATNVGVFAGSPAYTDFKPQFDALGVKLLGSAACYAGIHGEQALRVYSDPGRTAQELARLHPADGPGWRGLTDLYRQSGPRFLPLFFTELPSGAALSRVARAVFDAPLVSLHFATALTQSASRFAARWLQSQPAREVLLAWAYHFDFPPSARGGALFGFVAALSGQLRGMPVVQGGAGRLSDALRVIVEQAGGKVLTRSRVEHIRVVAGRAVAVVTEHGEEIAATKAIVANVTLRNLFGRLVRPSDLDMRFFRRAQAYRYGPGTFIIHLALDRPLEWRAAQDLALFPYVHLHSGEADLEATHRQSMAGLLPSRPMLIVSQPSAVDPSRAPANMAVLRIHVRTVPGAIRGDSLGTIAAQDWAMAKEPFAERILGLVEANAPALRQRIRGMAVETPAEIEQGNANFIGGDCVSGSHHWDQNFIWRPLRGWSRYQTPIDGLYMIGASTWPGGGITGGSGYLLAQRLLRGQAASDLSRSPPESRPAPS